MKKGNLENCLKFAEKILEENNHNSNKIDELEKVNLMYMDIICLINEKLSRKFEKHTSLYFKTT